MLINGVNVCGASRYHPACWAGVTSAPLRRCAVVISSTSSRVWYDHAEAIAHDHPKVSPTYRAGAQDPEGL